MGLTATRDELPNQDFGKSPSISIALTTCNGSAFLARQLGSIADQYRRPDELVVSDDASDDSTFDLLKKFAGDAPFPVKINRNKTRLGFRTNFMVCVQHCIGDLIAFCDQDDIWSPVKLSTQLADFDDPSIMLSCHNADLIDEHGLPLPGLLDQFPQGGRLDLASAGPLTFPRGFTQVARRDLFKWGWLREHSMDIGDPEQKMSHDGWLFFVALLHGDIFYHGEILAHHRQHGKNASGAVPSKWERLRWRLINRYTDCDRLARVWANRRDMLNTLLERETDMDEMMRQRVMEARHHYEGSALAAADRDELHKAKNRWTRARLFGHAVRSGHFSRHDPWKFSPGGAVKDAFSILF